MKKVNQILRRDLKKVITKYKMLIAKFAKIKKKES